MACDTSGANGWCVQAWHYSGSQPNGVGPSKLVSEGDQLEITYQYDSSAGTMERKSVLGNTGQILLDYAIGCGAGYSNTFSIECHSTIDNVPQHEYANTKIQLSDPNPSFNTTLHTERNPLIWVSRAQMGPRTGSSSKSHFLLRAASVLRVIPVWTRTAPNLCGRGAMQ